jgi:ATP-dependent helicase/nuclease subunit A
MNFTPEQHTAVTIHDRNLIVTAGAGSGKTRVLVERFIALLDAHPDWKLTDLVAITFTEKAAREMRDRVRDAVRDRVASDSSSHWREQESLLDNARIGTIHSLCAQILRANPAQVPVDPGFEVLDENEAHLLVIDAVEQALAELVELPAGELLVAYTVREVRQVLTEYASRSEAETFIAALEDQTPESLLQIWRERQAEQAIKCLTAVRQDDVLWESISWSPEGGFPPPESDDKLLAVWEDVWALAEQLQSDDPEEVYSALLEFKAVIELRGRAAKNWGGGDLGKAVLAESKAVLENIRETAKAYVANWAKPLDESDERAAELLFLWRDAIRLTSDIYHRLKAERAALDFDDLETLTVNLLREHPEIAARYASGEFKHVLVDEFQDTNARQRDLVYRLCGYQDHQPTMPPGRLFVVGDPKQSIYAFRGADVSVFNRVREEILEMDGQEIPLSRSFRTHETLVNGFNYAFAQILTAGDDAVSRYEVAFGEPMTAERPARDFHQIPIEVLILESPNGKRLNKDESCPWEAYEIARRIHQMVREAAPVYDKALRDYRPFRYGDAAILFRSLSNAHLYEEVFKAQALPYMTIGGRGYYGRQEVWDMLNLLKALHNPSDDLALASVLRSPMFGLSDDGLFALRLKKDAEGNSLSLWDALQSDPDLGPFPIPARDRPALEFARQCFLNLAALAGRVTVDQLLEIALDQTAYDAILTALPDGDRRRGNLDKLLEKARSSGRVSLSEFMVYIHDLTSVDPREGEAVVESADAVKLMTVHKSKGLEFPLVVIADADWERRNQKQAMVMLDSEIGAACAVRDESDVRVKPFVYQLAESYEARREAAESKRLLYVAATRAQDYLLISGTHKHADSWMGQIITALGIQGAGEKVHKWGKVRVTRPTEPPSDDELIPHIAYAETGWDHLDHLPEGLAEPPPLVRDIPLQPASAARHLSVTQLEELGNILYLKPVPAAGRRAFRQSVLHDAPPPIRPVEGTLTNRLYSRIIGSITHRVLQMGIISRGRAIQDLATILKAYAWDEGITDDETVYRVVEDVGHLLETFERGQQPESLFHAEQVLHEVPFIYQVGRRIIHGVIDVLYRYQDHWYVLDYKTADIRPDQVSWHAQRYTVQLGAYAQAVEERMGETPVVQLYYLHPGVLIDLPESRWRDALTRLDLTVDEALS